MLNKLEKSLFLEEHATKGSVKMTKTVHKTTLSNSSRNSYAEILTAQLEMQFS